MINAMENHDKSAMITLGNLFMGCRNRFSLEGFCINHRCSKISCIYGIHSSSATMDYEMLCDMTYVTYGMSS